MPSPHQGRRRRGDGRRETRKKRQDAGIQGDKEKGRHLNRGTGDRNQETGRQAVRWDRETGVRQQGDGKQGITRQVDRQ